MKFQKKLMLCLTLMVTLLLGCISPLSTYANEIETQPSSNYQIMFFDNEKELNEFTEQYKNKMLNPRTRIELPNIITVGHFRLSDTKIELNLQNVGFDEVDLVSGVAKAYTKEGLLVGKTPITETEFKPFTTRKYTISSSTGHRIARDFIQLAIRDGKETVNGIYEWDYND